MTILARVSTMKAKRISAGLIHGWLLYLLAGTFCWGQAAGIPLAAAKPVPVTSAPSKGAHSPQAGAVETRTIAPDSPVITISGLCDDSARNTPVIPACVTIITRAEFEKIVAAIQPNMSARARREFATRYAEVLVLSRKAEQARLDKGTSYEEQMKMARIEILSQEITRAIQAQASQVSDQDIVDYFRQNGSSFEQAEVDRIYVPRNQDPTSPTDKSLSEGNVRSQSSDSYSKELADKLHARAIAGEDFDKLQADAYKMAGIKTATSSNMGKIRRISLPPDQASIMDLAPGQVSSVIASTNGYFIYKIRTKEMLSLDQAREEIKATLRSQRIQEETRAIQESATPTLNEAYFYRPRESQAVTTAAK
jgi:hypothetical protein